MSRLAGRCFLALVICTLPAEATASQNPLLTRVQDLRQLQSEQAGSRPVRLRGVVTVVQDATAGLSIDRTDSADMHAGDEVEITGVTGPGLFAPVVIAHQVSVLGRIPWPEAKRKSYLDLARGIEDSQRVEIQGVIGAASVSESWDRQILFRATTVKGATLTARVQDFSGRDFSRLVDASVPVRGACGAISNNRRQPVGVRMFVPTADRVRVEESPPPDAFSLPPSPLRRFFQFPSLARLDHRLRIQ